MEHPLERLKLDFGYNEFREMQEDVVMDVLSGKDVFVLMPTGSGKSLCYQLPAVMKEGVSIVVSPLISLMKDQVDSLRANGIGASFINSTLTMSEIEDAKIRLLENKDKILYVAPERFASYDFIEFLRMLRISLFAVDEAHCISEWGHDFRPEYRNLKMLREAFPKVPIIALTATAVPEVQGDIISTLKLSSPRIYRASFNRPNLFYNVRLKEDTYDKIVDYVSHRRNESGIIYCQSRSSSEKLARKLLEDGFLALPYHAGLGKDERAENQERFIRDDAQIIVATIAFGMGINKPNVRYVIHYDLPKNIEGYYQETGRAGRDGLPSECILFFSYGDRKKIEALLDKSRNRKKLAIAYRKLDKMVAFCESRECRRKMLLNYFGEAYEGQCGKCDTCLTPMQTFDGTEVAKKIIACIKETRERFGGAYIISILTGGNEKRIIQYGHERLASYGNGKDIGKREWQSFIRELCRLGFISIEGSKYPLLRLNDKSYDILSGKLPVRLTKAAGMEDMPAAEREEISTKEAFDKDLFEALRILRKTIADAEHVPPYVIFHDTALREMSIYYPQNLQSMAQIKGVGSAKLEKYGSRFVEKIRGYCLQKDFNERKIPSKSQAKINVDADTYTKTFELIEQGFSLEDISTKRGLAPSTIESHIEKLIFSGKEINIDQFVSKEKQDAVVRCMQELGGGPLTPIKEMLGDGYSYEEIRLVRLKLIKENTI